MQFVKISLFSLCLSLFSIFAAPTMAQQNNFASGELLVKFKNGTASRAAVSVNEKIGASVKEEFPDLHWQRVKLPARMSVSRAIALYQSYGEIEIAQPNFYYNLQATPNDVRFGELYGMQKISAPAAWDLTTGSQQNVVAVIDTGIKYTHEDLAANMWTNAGEIAGNGIDDDGNGFVDDVYGYDFFYNDSDPLDENGHGTHVAGTIGAVGNNNLGVVGVNWTVRLMAIKIYSASGNGTTSAMLINAYNYVRMMRERGVNIRVTNNSYGGCDEACSYDQATKDAIDALGNANVLQVFAAGNNGQNVETTPFYPGSYTSPSILSVAASDSNDNKASFSNYGTTGVDVAAPGVSILSTVRTSANYGTLSGTSMASPHTAGAAALLAAQNPNLSAASLKATLMNSVDVLSNWNGIVKTGGRINVSRALQNQTVCAFNLSSNQTNADLSGGSYSVNVTAPTNCDYSAFSNAEWITVTGGSPGSGNGAVAFTVAVNNGLSRQGTIKIGDSVLTIQQNGGDPFSGAKLDFDGDGRTDFVAVQNNSGTMLWQIYQSSNGYKTQNFGDFNQDILVPNDFDGDGRADFAVWRGGAQGYFYVLRSSTNTFQETAFGATGDNPLVAQDYNGDGRTDFAVTREQNGKLIWYILDSPAGFRTVEFGASGDKPTRGDFDGDGKGDLAVYRNGIWYIQQSSLGLKTVSFGASDDKVVAGDYDGDRKTDIAVWRPSNGVWYYLKSSEGNFQSFAFGQTGDLPTPGDYDGDGKTDFGVWRADLSGNGAGIFYNFSPTSGFRAFGWGNSMMRIPANSILGE